MPTISAGSSDTFSFSTYLNSAAITVDPGERAHVSVLSSANVVLAQDNLASSKTMGPFPAGSVMTISAVNGNIAYTVVNASRTASAGANLTIPAYGTALAFRASQASNGNLIDQGPNANVMSTSTALFPVAWLANAVVAGNSYRTPPSLNGAIYKAGSTGGTNGPTEPAWPTTVGATVVSGTVTYTCEKGPYFVDNSGTRLVRSLASTQVGAAATHSLPASDLQWDMALGQSLIVHLRPKFDYAASGQAAASPILSNRELTGTNRGFRIVGTGGSFNDLRFNVRDSLGNSILSDNLSTTFARKPLDGTERSVVMMICGALKMMFVYIDGIPLTQADMFSGTSINPNGMNLASITGSTQGGALTIGGDPLGTTSFECAFKTGDVTPLPGGLPANIQNIASWYARGGEGVIPQYLLD